MLCIFDVCKYYKKKFIKLYGLDKEQVTTTVVIIMFFFVVKLIIFKCTKFLGGVAETRRKKKQTNKQCDQFVHKYRHFSHPIRI